MATDQCGSRGRQHFLQHLQHNQGAAGHGRCSLPGHLRGVSCHPAGGLLSMGLPTCPRPSEVDVPYVSPSPRLPPKTPAYSSFPPVCSSSLPFASGLELPEIYFLTVLSNLALLERSPRRGGHSILMKVPNVQLPCAKHYDK